MRRLDRKKLRRRRHRENREVKARRVTARLTEVSEEIWEGIALTTSGSGQMVRGPSLSRFDLSLEP